MTAGNVPRMRRYAAWAFGPLTVALGAVAHGVSGAAVPNFSVLLALAALLSMAASILAGLRFRTWMLLLASGAVQQLLHLAFAAFPGAGGSAPRKHPHDGPIDLPAPQDAPASGGHYANELMIDTHVAAALLTVVVLTQADRLFSKVTAARQRAPETAGSE